MVVLIMNWHESYHDWHRLGLFTFECIWYSFSFVYQDNPPHLKIHSYRAALEWIANQICPDFKRSAVQIPAKKTNKMDFER